MTYPWNRLAVRPLLTRATILMMVAGATAGLGAFVGLSVAVLPASLIVVPLAVLVLLAAATLWVLPELPSVPRKWLRRSFFVLVPVLACIPPYIAIDLPGLPWISLVRICLFLTLLTFLLCVFGAKDVRSDLKSTLHASKPVTYAFYALALTFVLSLPLSQNLGSSMKALSEAAINWFLPFLVAAIVIKGPADTRKLFYILAGTALFLGAVAVFESATHQRLFLKLAPPGLFAADSTMYEVMSRDKYRNGIYRASGSFLVPLSFAEYLAMVGPIAMYMVLYCRGLFLKLFGVAACLAALVAIILTGARGGLISFLVGGGVLVFFYALKQTQVHRGGLLGPFLLTLYAMGATGFIGLVFTWHRLNVMVFGGGETQGSTEARLVQWDMATPHIMSNPLTGNGLGLGASVVGFTTPGGTMTLDSYVITLLVETGIPGFLAFTVLLAAAVFLGIRAYLKAPAAMEAEAGLALPLACSLLGFMIYRLVLSQTENHTMMMVFLGATVALLYRLKVDAAEHAARAPETERSSRHRIKRGGRRSAETTEPPAEPALARRRAHPRLRARRAD